MKQLTLGQPDERSNCDYQREFEKLNGRRKEALFRGDYVRYAQLCDELGVSVEDDIAYGLGKFASKISEKPESFRERLLRQDLLRQRFSNNNPPIVKCSEGNYSNINPEIIDRIDKRYFADKIDKKPNDTFFGIIESEDERARRRKEQERGRWYRDIPNLRDDRD